MYLRSKFLNTTAFLFEKPNEGTEDNRSPAQKERDSINVDDSTTNDKSLGEEDNSDDNKDDDKDDNEDDGENENGDDTDDESDNENDDADDKEDKTKEKEETAEEKSARVAKEKEDRREARVQKRIDRAVAAEKAAKAEAAELRKQLAEKPVEGLTEEEVDRRAAAKAEETLKQANLTKAQKEFENTVDTLEAAAIKADKDFISKVSDLVEEVGKPVPSQMINILSDLDNENGGEVFSYLVSNPDEYEDIMDLPERKLTIKLTRLSDKLKEEKKPKLKERSKVPPPVAPINDNGTRNSNVITGKETQEEFNRKREAQIKARMEARGGY